MGGIFHLKLNIGERPIAYKYREGKMKRTLKRELKVREIAKRETLGTSVAGGKSAIGATWWCTFLSAGQHQLHGKGKCLEKCSCLQCYSLQGDTLLATEEFNVSRSRLDTLVYAGSFTW